MGGKTEKKEERRGGVNMLLCSLVSAYWCYNKMINSMSKNREAMKRQGDQSRNISIAAEFINAGVQWIIHSLPSICVPFHTAEL